MVLPLQKSLKFPADVEVSGEVKNLIRKLLTDRCYRLEFEGIKSHTFFANVNWSDLGSGEHMIQLVILKFIAKNPLSEVVICTGGEPWRSGREMGWRKEGEERESNGVVKARNLTFGALILSPSSSPTLHPLCCWP